MRSYLFVLLAGLAGCSLTPQTPTEGWFISSKLASPAACFRNQEGIKLWSKCSDLNGDQKTLCQVHALLDGDGEVFSNHTPVAVYHHFNTCESQVLIQSGPHEGEVYYCSTVHVRK